MKVYRIGRHADNDIVVDDKSISRRHAELSEIEKGRYRLVDLDSTNGTFVRRGRSWREVRTAEVDAHEIIMLGDYSTSPMELLAFDLAADPDDREEPVADGVDADAGTEDRDGPEIATSEDGPPPAPSERIPVATRDATPPAPSPPAQPTAAPPESEDPPPPPAMGAAPPQAPARAPLSMGRPDNATLKDFTETDAPAGDALPAIAITVAPQGLAARVPRSILWGALGVVVAACLGVIIWYAMLLRADTVRTATSPVAAKSVAPPAKVLTWQRILGGAKSDAARDIVQTADGGYIMVGLTSSKGAGSQDGWIVGLDAKGVPRWEKVLGEKNRDVFRSITVAPNGGFVIAGERRPAGGGKSMMWLVKIDDTGETVFEQLFPDNAASAGFDAIESRDGGFVIVGTILDRKGKDTDLRLFKINAKGNILWRRRYGGKRAEAIGKGFQQTADGGYVGAGETASRGKGSTDLWVFKLNARGVAKWRKTYGGAKADGARAIRALGKDGYIVAGYTESKGAGGRDIWVLRLDAKGAVIWDKTFGTPAREDATSIIVTKDGGFLVLGSKSGAGIAADSPWLIKLDGEGKVIWQRSYDATLYGRAAAIRQTRDGGYVIAGSRGHGTGRPSAGWVMKLDAAGKLAP